jgi:hypothetical protein
MKLTAQKGHVSQNSKLKTRVRSTVREGHASQPLQVRLNEISICLPKWVKTIYNERQQKWWLITLDSESLYLFFSFFFLLALAPLQVFAKTSPLLLFPTRPFRFSRRGVTHFCLRRLFGFSSQPGYDIFTLEQPVSRMPKSVGAPLF